MRPHRIVQVTSLFLSAVLAAAILQTPACSNGDTVLALTINSDQDDVGGPANLRVTVTPMSGVAGDEMFAPDLIDGAIITSFFRRHHAERAHRRGQRHGRRARCLGQRLPQRDDHRRSGRERRGGGAGGAEDCAHRRSRTRERRLMAAAVPVAPAAARRLGWRAARRLGWRRPGGNPSGNLITNGDFAAGMTNWRVDSGNGSNIDNGRFA